MKKKKNLKFISLNFTDERYNYCFTPSTTALAKLAKCSKNLNTHETT